MSDEDCGTCPASDADSWVAAFDPTYRRHYYIHKLSGECRWFLPSQLSQLQSIAQETDSNVYSSGVEDGDGILRDGVKRCLFDIMTDQSDGKDSNNNDSYLDYNHYEINFQKCDDDTILLKHYHDHDEDDDDDDDVDDVGDLKPCNVDDNDDLKHRNDDDADLKQSNNDENDDLKQCSDDHDFKQCDDDDDDVGDLKPCNDDDIDDLKRRNDDDADFKQSNNDENDDLKQCSDDHDFKQCDDDDDDDDDDDLKSFNDDNFEHDDDDDDGDDDIAGLEHCYDDDDDFNADLKHCDDDDTSLKLNNDDDDDDIADLQQCSDDDDLKQYDDDADLKPYNDDDNNDDLNQCEDSHIVDFVVNYNLDYEDQSEEHCDYHETDAMASHHSSQYHIYYEDVDGNLEILNSYDEDQEGAVLDSYDASYDNDDGDDPVGHMDDYRKYLEDFRSMPLEEADRGVTEENSCRAAKERETTAIKRRKERNNRKAITISADGAGQSLLQYRRQQGIGDHDLPNTGDNAYSARGFKQDYLNLARIYKLERPYSDPNSLIACILCHEEHANVVFFPCQHRCICKACLVKENICTEGQFTKAGGYCNCSLCAAVIKHILPFEHGAEVERYWQWVLQEQVPLPPGFMRNFRHSAAVIKAVYMNDEYDDDDDASDEERLSRQLRRSESRSSSSNCTLS